MTGDERTAATAVAGAEPLTGLRLLVLRESGSEVFDLPARSATIGRSRECEVRIDDASVSRKHAVLHVSGDAVTVEDLGSANGTKVDGTPVVPGTTLRVRSGSLVEVGSVRVLVSGLRSRSAKETPMQRTRALVESVAKGTISVLLLGETGSGKEVLARRIHELSPRAGGPFLAINCAAMPENLLESELFGFEKGAFTGATSAKPGLLESANGGTVLLDELGEMPLGTQAKLLRVLETRQAMPVGSLRARDIDVRFVAATNRDLAASVAEGRFREDLLFRVSGITIQVPPLREREDEIPELARDLLDEECRRAGKPKKTLTPAALEVLVRYRWPGNVRELRSALERAVLLAPGDAVDVPHLFLVAAPSPQPAPDGRTMAPPPPAPAASDDDPERARIAAALEKTGGNQTEAAKLLGLTRRALMWRMDRFGMARPRRK
jgi:transcriptional regulator with PAS, ATPase and Fis domain